jgi:hypothetical protein
MTAHKTDTIQLSIKLSNTVEAYAESVRNYVHRLDSVDKIIGDRQKDKEHN